MGLFNKTPEEIARRDDIKRKEAVRREEEIHEEYERRQADAFAKTPAGQARAARAAGTRTFQLSLPLSQTTGHYDRSTPQTNATNNISAYIGQKDGQVWLRYNISYRGDSWLFVQNYKLMLDGKVLDITPRKVDRDNHSYVWEWCDEPVDAPALIVLAAIAVSKDAKIRYEGRQYRKDRTITQNEKQAIKNVLLAFNALGGKVE